MTLAEGVAEFVLSDDRVVHVSSQPRFRREHSMTDESISALCWCVLEDMTIRRIAPKVEDNDNHRQELA